MSGKLNAVEKIKAESNWLAGRLAEELQSDSDQFAKDSLQLLKFHGTYQQDDRDLRAELRKLGIGKALYTLFLGGRLLGNRLAEVYRDTVPADEIVSELSRVLTVYKQMRSVGEGFGDFCNRIGLKTLIELCEPVDIEEVNNK